MIDPQAVADYLDLPFADQRLELCTTAAVAWAEKRRCLTPPEELWADPDATLGTIQYAALLYQSKAAPQGFNEYEEFSMQSGAAMVGIYRLVGQDQVIA